MVLSVISSTMWLACTLYRTTCYFYFDDNCGKCRPILVTFEFNKVLKSCCCKTVYTMEHSSIATTGLSWGDRFNPLNEHIKTAQQQNIIQHNGDWYTGRWWVCCHIWYSEEGPGPAAAPPSLLLAVPNVTAHPPTASIRTSYYLI